jgi:hypothetical protein
MSTLHRRTTAKSSCCRRVSPNSADDGAPLSTGPTKSGTSARRYERKSSPMYSDMTAWTGHAPPQSPRGIQQARHPLPVWRRPVACDISWASLAAAILACRSERWLHCDRDRGPDCQNGSERQNENEFCPSSRVASGDGRGHGRRSLLQRDAGTAALLDEAMASVLKTIVSGVDSDAARQDRNHDPDEPEHDNFKLAGRRHSAVLVPVTLATKSAGLCSPDEKVWHSDKMDTVPSCRCHLALQLQFIEGSESMDRHDSGSDDWWCVG